MKKLITVLVLIIIVAAFRFFPKETEDLSYIVTFEKCVEVGNPVMESFPEKCRDASGATFINWRGAGQACIQIITQATNPKTEETREFPTPCDVPEGWTSLN